MVIEIVDFPIKHGWIFYSYVSHYQRLHVSCLETGNWVMFLTFPHRSDHDGVDPKFSKSSTLW